MVKWGIATHFVEQDKMPQLYAELASGVTAQSTDAQIDEIVNSLSDSGASEQPIGSLDEIQAIFKPDSIQ